MEEKKSIKVSLGTVICIFIIFILIIVIGGMYFYYNFVLNKNNLSEGKQNNTVINAAGGNNIENNINEQGNIYGKYQDLYWLFNDTDPTEVKWDDRKIIIENGIAYLEINNTKQKMNSIRGKVKYITAWGEQTLQRVYVLTEDGIVWKSLVNGYDKETLNDDFKAIDIKGTVINMTNGYSDLRITEPPYFLLSTGELVNENGSKYEELEGNFVKSFGNNYEQIYVGQDNSISYYNYNTRNYIKIKDENGNIVKMKDAFVQWSSIYNDLVNETRRRRKVIYFDRR